MFYSASAIVFIAVAMDEIWPATATNRPVYN